MVVGTPLLQSSASTTCARVLTPFAYFALGNCLVGLILALSIKKEYRRQAVEEARERTVSAHPFSSALKVILRWSWRWLCR